MKNLLTSREFWVSILGLILVIGGQFLPGFKMDVGAAASLLIVVMSYLYGITVDPGPGGWKGVIQSRKFYAALVGFVLVVLDGFQIILPAGLTSEMLITLSVLVGSFIVTVSKQPFPEPDPGITGFRIDYPHRPESQ